MGCSGSKPEVNNTPAAAQKASTGGGQAQAAPAGKRTFDNVYTRGKTLGEGAFSVVIEATDKSTGESYAVKVVTKNKLTKEDEIVLKDEIQVLRELQHPHIIR
eukprot:565921_1